MGHVLGKARPGAELNDAQVGALSQNRKVEHGQATRAKMISQHEEIERNCGPPSNEEEVRRPYGVVHEGQALDIWGLILEKVTDPSEIGNLWKVCKMFQDILRSRYIQTRLPEVVYLILKMRPHYLMSEEAGDYADILTERNAKTSVFLKLRLLTKQCKISLEEITSSEQCEQAWLYLTTTGQLAGILENLGRNPSYAASFFPYCICIQEEEVQDDLEPFQQMVTTLLQLVGHRIKFFTYYTYLAMQRDIYTLARTWAGFMPNLKTISVGQQVEPVIDEPAPRLEDVEPFPNLPLLQSYEGGDIFAPYVQRILEAGPGTKDLQLLQYFKVREQSPQVVQNLVNLSSIQIQPYQSLLEHLHLPWKLKKIEFCFACFPWHSGQRLSLPSGRLFAFLKQFEETLEYLKIERVEVTNSCEYLELRNLKTLKMEFHKSFDNLNLLLYAEKLETLRVKIPGNVMWYLSPSKKFSRILEESFLGRSIWDVFPYLKKLQLCTSNYYRPNPEGPVLNGEMFEQYRRAQGVILKRNATFN